LSRGCNIDVEDCLNSICIPGYLITGHSLSYFPGRLWRHQGAEGCQVTGTGGICVHQAVIGKAINRAGYWFCTLRLKQSMLAWTQPYSAAASWGVFVHRWWRWSVYSDAALTVIVSCILKTLSLHRMDVWPIGHLTLRWKPPVRWTIGSKGKAERSYRTWQASHATFILGTQPLSLSPFSWASMLANSGLQICAQALAEKTLRIRVARYYIGGWVAIPASTWVQSHL